MITPCFKLSQNENHVFITVHAPYTNIKNTEVDVDGENFLFVSSPYFLRLQLPGKIAQNEENAKRSYYNATTGDVRLFFDKATPGEHFENLDMITSLLAPRDIPNINPDLVEVLEEDGITVDENDNSETSCENKSKFTYGFANKLSKQFSDIGAEFPQIFEVRAPEQVAIDERNKLRIETENAKFSLDHYLADFFDEEGVLPPALSEIPFWDDADFNKDAEFTNDEISILKDIPNKHYLLSQTEYKEVLLGLIDILFGYCYDKRTTLNENTVESGWTINKLSATLSCFCSFKNMKQVLVACYRRALIYPLFRNFKLCNKVKRDVISLLRKGKKTVIKCLLEIYQIFNTSCDARYILNQLYIKDYLVFVQKCRVEEIFVLYHNVQNVEIAKKDLDLDLQELERIGKMVQQEENSIIENEVAVKMASMSLLPDIKTNNSSHHSKSDESSSSSSSSDGPVSELDSDDDPY